MAIFLFLNINFNFPAVVPKLINNPFKVNKGSFELILSIFKA